MHIVCNLTQILNFFCNIYSHTSGHPCCNCIHPCHSLRFVPFIVKRQPMETTTPNHRFSQLYLFYNSRWVQVAEERLAYDWSLFLSDLGSSLGFLLGLSVLGIIGIMERLIDLLYGSLHSPARNIHQIKTNEPKQLDFSSNRDPAEKVDPMCYRTDEKSYIIWRHWDIKTSFPSILMTLIILVLYPHVTLCTWLWWQEL